VAYQINPAHSGAVTFSTVTFPTTSTWTVDLAATASYPLIADGKVFVTTLTSSGNSNLYALDQTTGGTVWGPVAIAGFASPAYDNGVVFVSSGVTPAVVQGVGLVATGSVSAYNAATGALLWNTPMNGFDYLTTSAPTAMNGYVYVTGGNTDPVNSGTFALNESTGAVTWFTRYSAAGNSSPAVSANGVYVDFTCGAYAYNPTTGQQLWSALPRCSSGIGGATPFLAGNTVFAPTPMTSADSGSMLDTTTGASTGTYSAAVPPVFDAQTGYFVQPNQPGGQGNLQAITLSSNTVKWTFTGESFVCSAMVISQYVIAEGCSGRLYGLDAATGQQLWVTNPGAPASWNFTSQSPLQGMAAGDGILVIPAGTKLVAYTLATNP
jgi:outer membrane protein assembly factor BamB